ncbi:MAG: HEAT repeat domain-containing protein [Methanomicrobiaceae archaeon]|nr:HEAT repeat domain-containing protein [Methanomicrobiaceae archaeon]
MTKRLLQELKSREWRTRSDAVASIGHIKGPEEVFALIAAVKEEKWYLRDAVAVGLGHLQSFEALAALIRSLSLEPWFIPEAMRALDRAGILPDPAELSFAAVHPDARIRQHAARALGVLRSEACLQFLGPMLSGDRDAAVRREAAIAIARIKTEASAGHLVAALRDPAPEVRRAVAGGLRKFGDPLAGEAPHIAAQDH